MTQFRVTLRSEADKDMVSINVPCLTNCTVSRQNEAEALQATKEAIRDRLHLSSQWEIQLVVVDADISLELHSAIQQGDLSRVLEFVQANSNALEEWEIVRSLCEAAFLGQLEIVIALADYVDINLRQFHRFNALDSAIENQQIRIVQWLLDHGANPNSRDENGWTPLIHALDVETDTNDDSQPLPIMTELLVAHGADVNAMSDSGQTPLSMTRHRHPTAEKILREHGALK